MKANIYFKTNKQSQIKQGIKNGLPSLLRYGIPFTISECCLGKDSQHLGRDGPPGCSCSWDSIDGNNCMWVRS